MADRMRIEQVAAPTTRALRGRVLRPGTELAALERVLGDSVDEAVHLAAYAADRLVGAVFIHPGDVPPNADDALRRLERHARGRAWRLRGMATEPDVRGEGYGAALVRACLTYVAERHDELLWCNAREAAYGFYERLGFSYYSDSFELKEIGPHRVMARLVTSAP